MAFGKVLQRKVNMHVCSLKLIQMYFNLFCLTYSLFSLKVTRCILIVECPTRLSEGRGVYIFKLVFLSLVFFCMFIVVYIYCCCCCFLKIEIDFMINVYVYFIYFQWLQL